MTSSISGRDLGRVIGRKPRRFCARFSRLALAIGSAALAVPAGADAPIRASMGPLVLGMSLEQARALQFTDGYGHANARLLCAGDKRAPGILDTFSTHGALACMVGADILSWGMVLGDGLTAKPMLVFKSGELIEVNATFSMDDATRVQNAITQRFGAPTSSKQSETHNGFGNTIPQIQVVWKVSGDDITMTAPSGKIDEFTVDYRDRIAADALDRAYASEKAAATGL